MEPAERKKRIAIALAGAAVALVMMGTFFAPIFKDFWHARQNGQNHANTPLFIFGGFFLFMVLMVVFSVWRGIRKISSPEPAAPPSAPAAKGNLGAQIFLFVFALPFAGFGIFALVTSVKKFSAGDSKNGLGLLVFGIIFAAVGFGLMAASIWGGKKVKEENELKARYAGQLWLVRPDWAAGKIKSTAAADTGAYLLMGLMFTAIGSVSSVFALPQELPKHNYAVLVVLLFPLVGIALLIAAARAQIARRRFGDCYFELAQIPAPLGGTLEGVIQAGSRIRLEHGLHLKLSCVRQITTGSGKNRHTQENILWQDEKVIRPEANLPETEPGRTGIPVFFKLPADQPEAVPGRGDGVHWRLEAASKMSGANFSVRFEVPVFQVAGAAARDAEAEDPTASFQETVEEIRRDEQSKIQVADGPAGREFYFPAARYPGMALVITLIFIVWSGAIWLMVVKHAPILFPIVFGLFDVLFFWGVANAWFRSSRVTVNSTGATVQNGWLFFTRTRRFDAADIARFDTKIGMTSGNTAYHDIKLIARGADEEFAGKMQNMGNAPSANQMIAGQIRQAAGPRGATVASTIANAAEAKWLAAEMNKALGR